MYVTPSYVPFTADVLNSEPREALPRASLSSCTLRELKDIHYVSPLVPLLLQWHRIKRNMSCQELARGSGVAIEKIAQCENFQLVLDQASFCKLCDFFSGLKNKP